MKTQAWRLTRLLLALHAPFGLGACVSAGAYNELKADRDGVSARNVELEEQVRGLAASNESLGAERIALVEDLEDLREAREGLRAEMTALERARLADQEAQAAQINELQGTYDALVGDLESELASGQIEIERLREGLRLNVADSILFPSGSAELSASGRGVIEKVAGDLASSPYRIEVRGHTDDRAIGGAAAQRYPTNWELAGARAAGVVRVLESKGVDPTRLLAISVGEYEPVGDNSTRKGRAQNRRIEVRLVPLGGPSEAEPAAEVPSAGDGAGGPAAAQSAPPPA